MAYGEMSLAVSGIFSTFCERVLFFNLFHLPDSVLLRSLSVRYTMTGSTSFGILYFFLCHADMSKFLSF